MPMVSSKLLKPPDNETVLTQSGSSLIFAAYHLGRWFEVPSGNEMSEPEQWLQVPFNEAPKADKTMKLGLKKNLPAPVQAESKMPKGNPEKIEGPEGSYDRGGEASGESCERECTNVKPADLSEQDSRGGQTTFDFND